MKRILIIEDDIVIAEVQLVNRTYLFIGISLQIVSLIAMFILSVFKPWGKRERKSKLSKKH
jgi:hypothetical protein